MQPVTRLHVHNSSAPTVFVCEKAAISVVLWRCSRRAPRSRAHGQLAVADEAEQKRAEIAARIGPEVLGLRWASGLSRIFVGRPSSRAPRLISSREQEVAVLVARGYSNRQIG